MLPLLYNINVAKGKVLIVEDEPKIIELLKLYLERETFQVVTADDGHKGLDLFQREKPDLIILDLMLPGVDGMEVCRTIRKVSRVPIIMLTARGEEIDRILGLELGADDYITKPFSPREVIARVNAVLRRTTKTEAVSEIINLGGLRIDLSQYEVKYKGRDIRLTPTEFKLLCLMAQHPGRVFTRLQLLDTAIGEVYEGYERTIDVHIKNLRQKVRFQEDTDGVDIVTIRGVGYKLVMGNV